MVFTRAQKTKNATLTDRQKSSQRLMDNYCTPSLSIATPARHCLNSSQNEDLIPPHNMNVTGSLPPNLLPNCNSGRADTPIMDLSIEVPDIPDGFGNWSLDPGLFENLSWPEVDICEPSDINGLFGKKLLAETPSQIPQPLHDSQLHSLCVQMSNQCLLQAKTSKKIFEKLNTMQQEILGLKALVHLIAKFFSDGILRVATPDDLSKYTRNELHPTKLPHGDKDDLFSTGPRGHQDPAAGNHESMQQEAHKTIQAPATLNDCSLTHCTTFPDDTPFNLTFSNKDLVTVDDWHEANFTSSISASSQQCSNKLNTLDIQSDWKRLASPPELTYHSPQKFPENNENSEKDKDCFITIFNWPLSRPKNKWMSAKDVEISILKTLGNDWSTDISFTCICRYPSNINSKRGRVLLIFKEQAQACAFWKLLYKFEHAHISFKWGINGTYDRNFLPPIGDSIQKSKFVSPHYGKFAKQLPDRKSGNHNEHYSFPRCNTGVFTPCPTFVSYPNNIILRSTISRDTYGRNRYKPGLHPRGNFNHSKTSNYNQHQKPPYCHRD